MSRKALIGAVLLILTAITTTPAMAIGNVITVTSAGFEVSPGDGCTLAEAIQNANDGAQTNVDCEAGVVGANEIDFHIGSGAKTIAAIGLVVTAADTTIDGTTQPGYPCGGGPCITLDGAAFGVSLTLEANNITVKGLSITNATGAPGYGLYVHNADNALIQGNYIGTDGSHALGNLTGIRIDSSDGVFIGGASAAQRNLISGNTDGIYIENGSAGTIIVNNWIGLALDGKKALGNGNGILVTGAGAAAIGGMGLGNVIAGSTVDHAIRIENSLTGSIIQHNLIGTNAAGTAALGNAGSGIIIDHTPDVIINSNTVAASHNFGIAVGFSSNVTIMENHIGSNAAGKVDFGINVFGIFAFGAPGITISSNQVSGGNDNGIQISGSNNALIQRNFIGTTWDGLHALPNQGNGIVVDASASVVIGGAPGDGNLISGNKRFGVALANGSTATISDNKIGTTLNGKGKLPNGDSSGRAGIGLETGAVATIANNLIAHNLFDGISVTNPGSSINPGSTGNCLIDNKVGEENDSGTPIVLDGNWWNSAQGPHTASSPASPGEKADAGFTVNTFLTMPPAACDFLYTTPPKLLTPKDNAFTTSSKVRFNWKALKHGTGYMLQLDNDSNVGSPDNHPVKKPTFTVDGLGYGQFFWRVWGDANGAGGLSAIRTFYVTIMKSPGPGKTVRHTTTPKFAWKKLTTATSYDLQVFSDDQCTTLFRGYTLLTGTTFKMPPADAMSQGMHSWQVTPQPGALMPCWSFNLTP